MGEAAPCLVRSFSQPASISCEFKEGNPLRALTTSISFGRFMIEPLDWEKWSAFSHNRTLEDVQKHSKPGSVAEKKAFFEAHYKKKAAKKAAKSPNKENQSPKHYSPETNNVSPTPSTNLVFTNIDENMCTGQVEHEKTSNDDVLSPSTNLVLSRNDQVEHEKTLSEDVSLEKVDKNSIQEQEQRTHIEDIQEQEEKTHTKDIQEQKEKTQIKDTQEQEEMTHIQNGNQVSPGQTKPGISSRKNGPYELQSPRKAPAHPIRVTKAARDLTEKKSLAPKSLHMSMNFSSARKIKDMMNSLLFANKNGNSKSVGKPKDRFAQDAQTRVLVNGVLKQVNRRPDNRRSKTPLDCSVNGSRTVVAKSSLLTKDAESSSACTKKPRSTTTPSSFSFRTEERAAKHKEFFKKLEEKGDTKETEKVQPLPKLKEKASNGHKKLRQSTALEAKPSTSETKPPSNSIQKVPPTRPTSPKLGRKPILVQDTCYQPPWRSSTKPKNFIEMNKKKLSSSMASLATKKLHKNASPNIQPSK